MWARASEGRTGSSTSTFRRRTPSTRECLPSTVCWASSPSSCSARWRFETSASRRRDRARLFPRPFSPTRFFFMAVDAMRFAAPAFAFGLSSVTLVRCQTQSARRRAAPSARLRRGRQRLHESTGRGWRDAGFRADPTLEPSDGRQLPVERRRSARRLRGSRRLVSGARAGRSGRHPIRSGTGPPRREHAVFRVVLAPRLHGLPGGRVQRSCVFLGRCGDPAAAAAGKALRPVAARRKSARVLSPMAPAGPIRSCLRQGGHRAFRISWFGR